jgi:hypothetical protein
LSNPSGTVGIGNVTVGKVTVAPPGPPHTYLGMARQLLHGVPPLASAGVQTSIALAFVAAQVAECLLKAYLSRGGDDKRLKNPPLQHNLAALWQLAEAEDLALSTPPPAWLSLLSELHDKPYFIRYSTGVHGMCTPAPEPMATELAALVELVARSL